MIDAIIGVMSQYPLVSNLIILALSFFIVAKAADLLILGIGEYARKFGISDYLIGFLVISMGTALPDFIAALMGALSNQGGIVLGTLIGSSICSIMLVFGVMGFVGKKIKVKAKILHGTKKYIFIMCVLPLVLISDGTLSRPDGFILVAAFAAYVVYLWVQEGKLGKLKSVMIKNLWRDVFIFLGALVALLLASRFLVFSSVNTANILGISPYFVALIIIGVGASMPDLTVELKSIIRGKTSIGFGNLLGGIIADMVFFLGLIALIRPINLVNINIVGVVVSSLFFAGTMGLVLWWAQKGTFTRKQGTMLLALYGLFLLAQIGVELLL